MHVLKKQGITSIGALRVTTTFLNGVTQIASNAHSELLGQGNSYCSIISLPPFIEDTMVISV